MTDHSEKTNSREKNPSEPRSGCIIIRIKRQEKMDQRKMPVKASYGG